MKYLVLFLSLSLSFFSCTKEEETKYENQDILEYMEKYIYETTEGSYGYFECVTEKEQIDSLSWKSDLYLMIYIYMQINVEQLLLITTFRRILRDLISCLVYLLLINLFLMLI